MAFMRRRPIMRLLLALVFFLPLTETTEHLRLSRQLQITGTAAESFQVSLFLALHFVSSATATELESKIGTNELVQHFCGAVHEQVRRKIVEQRHLSLLRGRHQSHCFPVRFFSHTRLDRQRELKSFGPAKKSTFPFLQALSMSAR